MIVLALSDWDEPRRIRRHLTEELINRGNRVLFVEAGFSLLKFLRTLDWKRLARVLRGLQNPKQGLFLIAAPPFLPLGEFSSLLSWLNWRITSWFVRRASRRLHLSRPILWVYAYNAASVVGTMNERVALYVCNDAFANLHSTPWMRRAVSHLEQELLGKVDLVVTVSEILSEEKRPFSRRVLTIHHGVDMKPYDEVRRAFPPAPADIQRAHRPRIGYVGVIRSMLDLGFVSEVARRRPEWSIVFVGPIVDGDRAFHREVHALNKLPNVFVLGPKNADELPLYLRELEVCMLPYRQSELLSYYAVPLKFYEYLAAGKPVVWTLEKSFYSESVVQSVRTPEDFMAAVEHFLASDSARHADDRIRIARENSWARRVDEIGTALTALDLPTDRIHI